MELGSGGGGGGEGGAYQHDCKFIKEGGEGGGLST